VTSALLDVEHLAVELAGHEALTDVTLAVPAGACLGLVGETGSGKTITCKALIGRLPRIGGKITRGTMLFDGIDLQALDEHGWHQLRGRRIALVPQASMSGLDPVMKVGRQLAEAVRELDRGAARGERVQELLNLVHMPRPGEVTSLYPHELSGGMRQRVMIALALTGHPELLFADEPTTALDVTVQRGILELLLELRQNTGMAIVFVTHDLGVVQSSSDSLAVMYSGAVVERGPSREVLARPAHPYTQALIRARPRTGGSRGALATIPGRAPGLGERPDGCPFAPRCPLAQDHCRSHVPHLVPVAHERWSACFRWEELLA
jgi:oligopeptide/dipeptide ABC transporter ATP-binding protein